MSQRTILLAALLALVSLGNAARGVVFQRKGGDWPRDWPAELDPLRAEAAVIDVATGTQEKIYEITFANGGDFAAAWPALLKVRTPGSPITLQPIRVGKPGSWESIASNAAPKVRIYVPSQRGGGGKIANILPGETMPRKGAQMLPYRLGPPWPAELVGSRGELPAYVQAVPRDGKAVLVEYKRGDALRGFHYRARIDLELVVDGKIIDLNRIEFPADARIEDHRFETKSDAPNASR